MAALAALAMGAAPATAAPKLAKPTLVDQRGKRLGGAPARWLRQSKMPLFTGRLRVVLRACPARPQFSGCVYTRRPRRLYVKPSSRNLKAVLYHEMGHSFDLVVMRTRHRRAFKRTMGLRRPGWFAGKVAPSELFAEAYALCARFGSRRPSAARLGYTGSIYGYRPTRRQHRVVCRLIVRAGTPPRRGRPRPAPSPPPGAPPVTEQVAPPAAPTPAPQNQPPQRPQPQPLLPGLPPLPLPLPTYAPAGLYPAGTPHGTGLRSPV